MNWRKLGLIYSPSGEHPQMLTHASNPTPEPLGNGLVRVYFSSRDQDNRSHIGWVDCELTPKPRVVRIAEEPIVTPGALGGFDDSGTSMGCLLQVGGRRFLYYLGWNLGVTVPWRNSIGLAISESPQSPFVKCGRAPIVDRSEEDPYSVSYPWVIADQGIFRMWYGSNLTWGQAHSDMGHVIKHAVSDDGIHWRRDGRVALGGVSEAEYALARPCVVKEGDTYVMWFCARGDQYRIYRAESHDGVDWRRTSLAAELAPTPGSWDGAMTAYPAVLRCEEALYMFYNGDGYGRTGFGLAVSQSLQARS